MCSSTDPGNMCPHYTCDCVADVMNATFGECVLVVEGMGQVWTCIEDGTDPEPYHYNICPTVASTGEPEYEPDPEPSDDSPTPEPEHEPEPEPSDDGPTPEPEHDSESEPSDDGSTPEPS